MAIPAYVTHRILKISLFATIIPYNLIGSLGSLEYRPNYTWVAYNAARRGSVIYYG